MRLFPDHSVFEPGEVMWDNLDDRDPTRLLGDQESLWGCEDAFTVRYPNGALLDLGYYGNVGETHRVVVVIVPPGAEEWTPAVEREVADFEELRQVVLELAAQARDWKN